MTAILMGLDLSATAAAACVVPLGWDGSWRHVRTLVVGKGLPRGASDRERALRKGYAFSQNTSAHTLAEVGGCVRLELVRAGIAIHTANIGTARKLLLGKLPRKGAKHAAHAALHTAGSPPWTLDEADAFVCANFGLSDHAGVYCFCQVGTESEVA